MKNVKRAILGIGILSAGLLSAQSAEMNNMLKIGGNVGIAAPSTNASANLGLDALRLSLTMKVAAVPTFL